MIIPTSAYKVFENLFTPNYLNLIHIDDKDLARPLQQLQQIMEKEEDWNRGTKMLRKAAFLLTRGKLKGKIAVSEDFVAYPIDWELEGQEFEEVLRDCGQSDEVIRHWKDSGWI